MKKVSETGIEKFTEQIGSGDLVMNIRVETTAEGKRVSAPVVRDEKQLAQLIRETDGSTLLTIRKDATLSAEEFSDVFTKSAAVLAEIFDIKDVEE